MLVKRNGEVKDILFMSLSSFSPRKGNECLPNQFWNAQVHSFPMKSEPGVHSLHMIPRPRLACTITRYRISRTRSSSLDIEQHYKFCP